MRNISFAKRMLFSFIPLVFMVATIELLFRTCGLANPSIVNRIPIAEDSGGLVQNDAELFWAPKPNLAITFAGKEVKTNSLGLRGEEVTIKGPNEYRILSLGESTTFGYGVGNEETYSAVLEKYLNASDPKRNYRVINAGVGGYSSFQSLMYLKLKGVQLNPDLVLFYHEINDYIPSSVRNAGNNELGFAKSDMQIYHSTQDAFDRKLMYYSAAYRFARYYQARRRIDDFQTKNLTSPMKEIGMQEISARLLGKIENGKIVPSDVDETKLPPRVYPAERLQVLKELKQISEDNHIELLIIHPSYRDTIAHQCLLTDFCKDHDVAMVDTFEALHGTAETLFSDPWHPDAVGHDKLAKMLSRVIRARLQ